MKITRSYLLSVETPNGWITEKINIFGHNVSDADLISDAYWRVERDHTGFRFRIYLLSNNPEKGLNGDLVYDSDQTYREDDSAEEVVEAFMDKCHIGSCPNCQSVISASDLVWSNQIDKWDTPAVIIRFVCSQCGADAFSMAEIGMVDHPIQVMEKYL